MLSASRSPLSCCASRGDARVTHAASVWDKVCMLSNPNSPANPNLSPNPSSNLILPPTQTLALTLARTLTSTLALTLTLPRLLSPVSRCRGGVAGGGGEEAAEARKARKAQKIKIRKGGTVEGAKRTVFGERTRRATLEGSVR
eukprot:4074030-Pleurochrysis_carterae.AAC.1